jgi:hypothetical protein
MNKKAKTAILNAFLEKVISKKEAKTLLQCEEKDILFKSVIYPDGTSKDEGPGDPSLIPLLEKAKIDYIRIKRKIIS